MFLLILYSYLGFYDALKVRIALRWKALCLHLLEIFIPCIVLSALEGYLSSLHFLRSVLKMKGHI